MERCWLDHGTVGDAGGGNFCLIHGLSAISTLSRISHTLFVAAALRDMYKIYIATRGELRIRPARE